jgi:hypothetical protein
MTDKPPVVHIGENSPEHVAYTLMVDVMRAESKTIAKGDLKAGWSTADRKYLLDTYAECLLAARGYRG